MYILLCMCILATLLLCTLTAKSRLTVKASLNITLFAGCFLVAADVDVGVAVAVIVSAAAAAAAALVVVVVVYFNGSSCCCSFTIV